MVTLKDVAEVAGVSISTVSRVFTGKAAISEETRQKVMGVAEELMFKKGLVSQKLTAENYQIAIIIPDSGEFYHDDPSTSADIRSLEQSFQAQGDAVTLLRNSNTEGSASVLLAQIRTLKADGVILFDSLVSSDLPALLSAEHIPFLLTNGVLDNPAFSFADFDNFSAMKELAETVIAAGHTRLAVLTGPDDHLVNRNRMDGLAAALAAAGIELEPALVRSGFFALESGYERMTALLPLLKERRCTAVIAFSDYIALGAMKALRQAGLRIPQDISIVGFDDVSFAAFSDPALTTVRRDLTGMADLLGRNIRELISLRTVLGSVQVRIKTTFVGRDSLARRG